MNRFFPFFKRTPTMEEDKEIPQNQPLCPEQVVNNAGGFAWKVDDMNRLRRFLCLGCEGGSYYQTEQKLGLENAQCIQRLIENGKGIKVVDAIVDFSISGRTARQNAILFALALCARNENDEKTKKAAYDKLCEICRIPTHLFSFVEYCEALSRGTGWGRAHTRAIRRWYTQFSDSPLKLAMHTTKYRSRDGWSHRDVLRLCHLKPENHSIGLLTRYIVKGINLSKEQYLIEECSSDVKSLFEFLDAVEAVKSMTDEDEAVGMVLKHGLVREHLPTNLLNSVKIWKALLHKMPMTAMIRNLGKMSSLGLFSDDKSEETLKVVLSLTNEELLKKAKIHPFHVLVALKVYEKGGGHKGKLKWKKSEKIVEALNEAFYISFKNVEPTNKRYCLALDVSGSMSSFTVNGSECLTAREAAAAMLMVTLHTESTCQVLAFSDTLVDLKVDKNMTLPKVITETSRLPFGGTDCSLPIVTATEKNELYDVFVVYTDNETWVGEVHPAQALRNYRRKSGIWDAKLIVVAMSCGEFTIADPDDPGMLDMAGFDSAAPQVMREFSLGRI